MAKTLAAQRRDAAEEVCWTLMLMMGVTDWDIQDPAIKEWFSKHFDVWVDLAVRSGSMRCCCPEKGQEHEDDCEYTGTKKRSRHTIGT